METSWTRTHWMELNMLKSELTGDSSVQEDILGKVSQCP